MQGNKRHFIAVEGPIGVGKTTLAKRLAQSFESELLLEGAAKNPFLERYYQKPQQAAMSTQLFFLLQRAQQIQGICQDKLFTSVWIADFLMEKDRLFAELTLNSDEMDLYNQVCQYLTIDTPIPNVVIYLQAPVEVLAERIKRRGVRFEQGISHDYLQRLSASYMDFFHHYTTSPLLIVNTQWLDFANSDEDYALLLEHINTVEAGRHYLNASRLLDRESRID